MLSALSWMRKKKQPSQAFCRKKSGKSCICILRAPEGGERGKVGKIFQPNPLTRCHQKGEKGLVRLLAIYAMSVPGGRGKRKLEARIGVALSLSVKKKGERPRRSAAIASPTLYREERKERRRKGGGGGVTGREPSQALHLRSNMERKKRRRHRRENRCTNSSLLRGGERREGKRGKERKKMERTPLVPTEGEIRASLLPTFEKRGKKKKKNNGRTKKENGGYPHEKLVGGRRIRTQRTSQIISFRNWRGRKIDAHLSHIRMKKEGEKRVESTPMRS